MKVSLFTLGVLGSASALFLVGCQQSMSNIIHLRCIPTHWTNKDGERKPSNFDRQSWSDISINPSEKSVQLRRFIHGKEQEILSSNIIDGKINAFSNGVVNKYFVSVRREKIRFGFVKSSRREENGDTTNAFNIDRVTGEFMEEYQVFNLNTRKKDLTFSSGNCKKLKPLKTRF